MIDTASALLQVGAALAAGLLIGIERGWRLREEKAGTRVAGIRTFTLLAFVAGLAGLLTPLSAIAGGALVFGAVGIVVAGYAHNARLQGSADATSAIAALVTVALGYAAGIGQPAIAVAGGTLAMLVLAMRNALHGLLARMEAADLVALARYAVIAGAVYPFLPSGAYGPYGAWEPRALWLVIVAVTGFSFLGYVASRVFGARRGAIATAVIGGAYSSTAVTYAFAQRLGAGEGGAAETAGIAIASGVMYLRVLVLVALLAWPILPAFALLLAPAILVAAAAALWLAREAGDGGEPVPPRNPIAILPALGFVAFVAAAAVAARWGEANFGEQGIAVLLLFMGTMDVDAAIVTAGGLEPGAIAPALAALALGGTILANMTVKLGATLAFARGAGRRAAMALGASMAALAGSLAVGWSAL